MTGALIVAALCALQAAAPRPTVERLAWLQGCWESRDGSVAEQWMKPGGGSMLAMGRTTRDGRTVAYEFIRVWQDVDGAIYFTARPSGQPEASFKLVRATDREAVFENPEHDFPQRIIYRLADDGSLLAGIEGKDGEKVRGESFPMKRARCDAP